MIFDGKLVLNSNYSIAGITAQIVGSYDLKQAQDLGSGGGGLQVLIECLEKPVFADAFCACGFHVLATTDSAVTASPVSMGHSAMIGAIDYSGAAPEVGSINRIRLGGWYGHSSPSTQWTDGINYARRYIGVFFYNYSVQYSSGVLGVVTAGRFRVSLTLDDQGDAPLTFPASFTNK